MSESPNTADGTPQSVDAKRDEMAMHLAAIVRLAKEIPAEGDPYAGVNIPDPIGDIEDVSNHPAVHRMKESFDAAETELGFANAVMGAVRRIGQKVGIAVTG